MDVNVKFKIRIPKCGWHSRLYNTVKLLSVGRLARRRLAEGGLNVER
jgi:hypothetical protein